MQCEHLHHGRVEVELAAGEVPRPDAFLRESLRERNARLGVGDEHRAGVHLEVQVGAICRRKRAAHRASSRGRKASREDREGSRLRALGGLEGLVTLRVQQREGRPVDLRRGAVVAT